MVWINWGIFADRWLARAERGQEYIDDGDRFISLWIAFNGWMKGKFGEAVKDRTLINRIKNSDDVKQTFNDLIMKDNDFAECLKELSQFKVVDMRDLSVNSTIYRYDGTFDSLIELIYQVRCNLFHGRKDIDEDRKDFELVRLSYQILLPLFKSCLSDLRI